MWLEKLRGGKLVWKLNLSCCSLLSILLLRTGPAAGGSSGHWPQFTAELDSAPLAPVVQARTAEAGPFAPMRGGRMLGAFAPAWIDGQGSLRTRMCSLLLRGGCAGPGKSKPAACSFCTKVHGFGDRCKADRTMEARAAAGRRAHDGWALLSTKRGEASDGTPARDVKVGQPKGVSEYGWGATAYAESTASQPQFGKKWEGDFCVLGIETSCDDTAAAIVHSNGTILGESKRTQDQLHALWGGVVPGLARDAHEAAIEEVISEALSNAALTPGDVDAVAVTMGPGLEICLRVGFRRAREIALAHKRTFVSVHHLEAHVLTVRQTDPTVQFPFLVLLVSGGHCQLLVAVAVGEYKMLGGTLDDSLGEAYDKSARMLGLDVGGGGGQVLEALATRGDPLAV
jgi:hypothetical protein